MNSKEVIERVHSEMPFLKTLFWVDEIGVFGSFARGDEKEKSDLNILVKLHKPNCLNLTGLLNYPKKLFIENYLSSPWLMAIATKHKYLFPRFLQAIEKEIIYA